MIFLSPLFTGEITNPCDFPGAWGDIWKTVSISKDIFENFTVPKSGSDPRNAKSDYEGIIDHLVTKGWVCANNNSCSLTTCWNDKAVFWNTHRRSKTIVNNPIFF